MAGMGATTATSGALPTAASATNADSDRPGKQRRMAARASRRRPHGDRQWWIVVQSAQAGDFGLSNLRFSNAPSGLTVTRGR